MYSNNLIIKRQITIAEYLSKFVPNVIADLISDYDYYLEGKSIIAERCRFLNMQDEDSKTYYISNNRIAILSDGIIVNGSHNLIELYDLQTEESDYIADHSSISNFNSPIYCIAVLSDNRVVTGSDNGEVKIWNVYTHLIDTRFTGHNESVLCIGVLSDERIVTGSRDTTLKTWNPFGPPGREGPRRQPKNKSSKSLTDCDVTLVGHNDDVFCVVTLSDNRIVSGSLDNTIKIWNSQTGDCEITLTNHNNMIICITLLPNGKIVSGSNDATLGIINPQMGICEEILIGHKDSVNCVTYHPDGLIISGSNDCTLKVWEPVNFENKPTSVITRYDCKLTLTEHLAAVICVAVLPDGRIVSASSDKTLKIWDLKTGICDITLTDHTDWIVHINVLSDGRIISGSDDNTIRIWS
jgi:WD40 repeat protein